MSGVALLPSLNNLVSPLFENIFARNYVRDHFRAKSEPREHSEDIVRPANSVAQTARVPSTYIQQQFCRRRFVITTINLECSCNNPCATYGTIRV